METCPCWVAKNGGKSRSPRKTTGFEGGMEEEETGNKTNSARRPADECFGDHDVQGCTFPDSG